MFAIAVRHFMRLIQLLLAISLMAAVVSCTPSALEPDPSVELESRVEPLTPLLRLNCGGSSSGSFQADQSYAGGAAFSSSATVSVANVVNAAPASVYQSERYGNFSYTFSGLSAGASYSVRLHFAEIYWTSAGQRLFRVALNATEVLSNFDIFSAAQGANKAVVREFTVQADGSGKIVATFVSVRDNAKLSGIELSAIDGASEAGAADAASGDAASGSDAGATNDGGPRDAAASDSGTSAGSTLSRVNSGGASVGAFSADQFATGGSSYSTTATVTTSGVTGAAPMAVYQTERFGNFSYTFAGLSAGAPYTLRLHFAEIYWTSSGNRLFDVTLNGTRVLSNFDIVAAAGGPRIAVVRDFSVAADSAGKVVVSFASVKDAAKVSGLELGTFAPAASDAGVDASSDAGGEVPLDAGPAPVIAGPLRASANPHYFQDANGKAVFLAGSHTWNDLQDWATSGTRSFDFAAYVQFLRAHGHNFTLLWRTELPKFCGLPTTDGTPPAFFVAQQPWLRTGPGTASDGGLKFDLTRFDQSYFDRLRARVIALNDAGIWAGVYFFSGEWLDVFRCAGDGHPLTGGNNINGVDDGGGSGAMNMTSQNAVLDAEDALARKMVDTLNDLPNVVWIVSEEAAPSTTWFQRHMIATVRSYEATKPKQHPIGLGAITGQPDGVLYDSDADWVAPWSRLSPSDSCGAGTPACKVNINDSDHSYFGMWNDSAQANRNYAWQNFTRGNHVVFMDPYTVYYPRQNRNLCSAPNAGICSAPDPRYDNFRDNLGYMVSYSRKMNLNKALPSTTLCSTTYCLGQTPAVGTELLVYAPSGGTFSVDLHQSAGRTLRFEWFDPDRGLIVQTGTISGGSSAQNFQTPSVIAGDSVLYLVDSAGHAL